MPSDFVVFMTERLATYRFVRDPAGDWNQYVRSLGDWQFHDNVGEPTVAAYFKDATNEVFVKKAAE